MDLAFGKLTQFAIENDQAEIVDLLIYPLNPMKNMVVFHSKLQTFTRG